MTTLAVDEALLESVAARLDLREPNREAVESIICEISQHFDVEGRGPPFDAIVDSATGMGKTYILAACIEYFAAARGVRNFAVIAPGRTIRDKTIANFTVGHRKSLLGGMEVVPVLVTADSFVSAGTRAAMDDESQVKIYVFTIQSLLKPTTDRGRKTHEFQEGLGGAFYKHLQGLTDLVVFADEHHCYAGRAFSEAIRELVPWAVVGLTATPLPGSESRIIYKYPLAAAIADRYVKTPVIVGRKDDRSDIETKLLDGATLLRAKSQAAEAYAREHGAPMVHPVMLVITENIEEAEEYAEILKSPNFDGGEWAGRVLTVHSDAPDEALEQLEQVEDADSRVRVIVAVGMLKEGWDVKNVYVVASTRPSVSSILTEQTLGRGMRLPWGKYTGVEMLDTLEVLAHERYEELLRRANVLNEAFVDQRTRALLRVAADGEKEVARETEKVAARVVIAERVAEREGDATVGAGGSTRVVDMESRKQEAKSGMEMLRSYSPKLGVSIRVPRLMMRPVPGEFSLADVTNYEDFRKLGVQLSADPEGELRRMRVSARVEKGPDGLRRTVLEAAPAADTVQASAPLFESGDARSRLADAVLHSEIVTARNYKREAKALEPIIDAFFDGLGTNADTVLASFHSRASARLIRLVTEVVRRTAPAPKFSEVVEVYALEKVRERAHNESRDRAGTFVRQDGYLGWKKSLYACEWFDSEPERNVANTVDESAEVSVWLKLKNGELPILWKHEGREYNADLVVVEKDGTHWVVEVKSDRDAQTGDVGGKREAARRWVSYVNTDPKVEVKWRYVLVTETDIAEAKGSWSALKRLGV